MEDAVILRIVDSCCAEISVRLTDEDDLKPVANIIVYRLGI